MGKKFTFILLFIFIGIYSCLSFSQTSTGAASSSECPNDKFKNYSDGRCYTSSDKENYILHACAEYKNGQISIITECEKELEAEFTSKTNLGTSSQNQNNNQNQTCDENSTPATHQAKDQKGNLIQGGGSEIHCMCKNPRQPNEEYNPKFPNNGCQPVGNLGSSAGSCKAKIEDEIDSCDVVKEKAWEACNIKDEKNAKFMDPATQAWATVSAIGKNNAASGALMSCKLAAGASATGAYALNAVKASCQSEKSMCLNKCSSVKKYETPQNLKDACPSLSNSEITNISNRVQTIFDECDGLEESALGKSLKEIESGLKESLTANQQAVQCAQQLDPDGCKANPLQMHCKPVLNCLNTPNDPNCINCALDRTNPACKCQFNPEDPSCKTRDGRGASTIATQPTLPNYKPVGVVGTGATNKFGSTGGSSKLGDMGLNPKIPSMFDPNKKDGDEKDKSSDPFAAASASSSSAGGGGDAGGSGAGKKGAAEEHADNGLFGGTFQAVKNAASNFFGGGSSGRRNTGPAAAPIGGRGNDQFVNKGPLRGVANNNNERCFVDSKSQRLCFPMGTPNTNIFEKVNTVYNRKLDTFH